MAKIIKNDLVQSDDSNAPVDANGVFLVLEHQSVTGETVRCANDQYEGADGAVTKGRDYKVIKGHNDGAGLDEAIILDDNGEQYVAQLNPENPSVSSGFFALFRIVDDEAFQATLSK